MHLLQQWVGSLLAMTTVISLSDAIEDVQCGQTLLSGDKEGFLYSPAFPRSPQSPVSCKWHIDVPDTYVAVVFQHFNLQGAMPSCELERITLSEVRNSSASTIVAGRVLCGPKTPIKYYSTTNKLVVEYFLKAGRHPLQSASIGTRFVIHYESVSWRPADPIPCGSCIHSTVYSDSVSSPGFPIQYGINCQCQWHLSVQKGYRINLKFTAFSLEDKVQNVCIDQVKIYDGTSAASTLLGAFCGRRIPATIKTSSKDAYMTFYSDFSDQFSGFQLVFDGELDERDLSGLRSVAAILGGVSFAIFAFLLLCSVVYKKYFGNRDTVELSHSIDIEESDGIQDAVQASAPPSYRRVMAEPELYPRTPEMTPTGSPRSTPLPSPLPHRLLRPSPLLLDGSNHLMLSSMNNSAAIIDMPLSPPPPYPGVAPPSFEALNIEEPEPPNTTQASDHCAAGQDRIELAELPSAANRHDNDIELPRHFSDDTVWHQMPDKTNRNLRKSKSTTSLFGLRRTKVTRRPNRQSVS